MQCVSTTITSGTNTATTVDRLSDRENQAVSAENLDRNSFGDDWAEFQAIWSRGLGEYGP
jgi:hypothetical protein